MLFALVPARSCGERAPTAALQDSETGKPSLESFIEVAKTRSGLNGNSSSCSQTAIKPRSSAVAKRVLSGWVS